MAIILDNSMLNSQTFHEYRIWMRERFIIRAIISLPNGTPGLRGAAFTRSGVSCAGVLRGLVWPWRLVASPWGLVRGPGPQDGGWRATPGIRPPLTRRTCQQSRHWRKRGVFRKNRDAASPGWGDMRSGDASDGVIVLPQIRVYSRVAP